jgi:hypothetical protein
MFIVEVATDKHNIDEGLDHASKAISKKDFFEPHLPEWCSHGYSKRIEHLKSEGLVPHVERINQQCKAPKDEY